MDWDAAGVLACRGGPAVLNAPLLTGVADDDNTTLMHAAARLAPEQLLASMAAAGGNVNARGAGGATPLHMAIVKLKTGAVRVLVELGADVHAQTKDSLCGNGPNHPDVPLSLAATYGFTEAVEILLAAGADVDGTERASSMSPLCCAVRGRHVNTARVLVKAGAQVMLGQTPLLHAVSDREAELVSLLCEYGADVHEKVGSQSMVSYAAGNCGDMLTVLTLLITYGADPAPALAKYRGDVTGSTLIDLARQANRSRHGVEDAMLVPAEAPVKGKDLCGCSKVVLRDGATKTKGFKGHRRRFVMQGVTESESFALL